MCLRQMEIWSYLRIGILFIFVFIFIASRKNSFQILIKKMPESELSANRMGWNAAHFAAKVYFYLQTQLTNLFFEKSERIEVLKYLCEINRSMVQEATKQNATG